MNQVQYPSSDVVVVHTVQVRYISIPAIRKTAIVFIAIITPPSREVNEARGGLMLEAGHVRSKKKKNGKIRSPTQTHHEIHSSPATASNSRRHVRKHVTSVSPYRPASIDPGFVEIGLVQLSQSVKTTHVTHTLTDTQTYLSLIHI